MQIVRPPVTSATDRTEVPAGLLWDDSSGSDFYFEPDLAGISGTGNAEDLSDVGWTATSLAFVQGVAADFFSSTDVDPSHYLTNAALDLLESPAIFGDYQHSQQAASHLGKNPTTLTMEAWAKFSVTSANEAATGIGFVIGGGSIITSADHVAVIVTDGTNFLCRNSDGSDAGAADDESWHLFKIVISNGAVTGAIEWFIDGVSQGTFDRRTDAYPCLWGAGVQAAATNRILIGPARIYYR